ncbi:uncharacterized protein [Antedon mediterranea]|uniref:uncharacterized protein isoform X2 n=1 Tax=Antedon mediterranea TaxID=105859 RepID=UPI003AF76550
MPILFCGATIRLPKFPRINNKVLPLLPKKDGKYKSVQQVLATRTTEEKRKLDEMLGVPHGNIESFAGLITSASVPNCTTTNKSDTSAKPKRKRLGSCKNVFIVKEKGAIIISPVNSSTQAEKSAEKVPTVHNCKKISKDDMSTKPKRLGSCKNVVIVREKGAIVISPVSSAIHTADKPANDDINEIAADTISQVDALTPVVEVEEATRVAILTETAADFDILTPECTDVDAGELETEIEQMTSNLVENTLAKILATPNEEVNIIPGLYGNEEVENVEPEVVPLETEREAKEAGIVEDVEKVAETEMEEAVVEYVHNLIEKAVVPETMEVLYLHAETVDKLKENETKEEAVTEAVKAVEESHS